MNQRDWKIGVISAENAKFVVLEGITPENFGNRFYTQNLPKMDQTKGYSGEVWYRILGYSNTKDEAYSIIANAPENPKYIETLW